MIEVRYYFTAKGRSPFEEWYASIDVEAKAKVMAAIARLERGITTKTKAVGGRGTRASN